MDAGDSGFRMNLIHQSLQFIYLIFTIYKIHLKPYSIIDELVNFSIEEINKASVMIVSQEIKIVDDFEIIHLYNKHSLNYKDPIETAKFILSDFNDNIGAIIPFIDTLHYLYFSLDEFKVTIY